MQDDDIFLTLIGPLGPFVEFDEYLEYQDKTIRALPLEAVLIGIKRAPEHYGRWLDDVAYVGLAYADAYPQHEQRVRQALLEIGLDPWTDDEAIDSL